MNTRVRTECTSSMVGGDTGWVDPNTETTSTGDAGLAYRVAYEPVRHTNNPSRRKIKLYKKLAQLVGAVCNCAKSSNLEWYDRHNDKLDALVHEYMPSGAGIDGTRICIEQSTPNKLVFSVAFHHFTEHGMYDSATLHRIKITPSLQFDFDLKVSGKNKNGIKEYLADIFNEALTSDIEDTLNQH